MSIYDLSTKDKCYALFGFVLGDGYFLKSKERNSITIRHTNRQRDYVKFICKFCEKTGIKYSSRFDFIGKTSYGEFIYSEVRLWVPEDGYFAKVNRVWDEKGIKIPSEYALNRINQWGLLFWWLDDGCLSIQKQERGTHYSIGRNAFLNTQGFSLVDNQRIQRVFFERWGIYCSINRDRHYYRLRFNATNFQKYFDLVRHLLPSIPQSLWYKFSMQYEPNRLINSKLLAEKYNLPIPSVESSDSKRVPSVNSDDDIVCST